MTVLIAILELFFPRRWPTPWYEWRWRIRRLRARS